MDFLKNTGRVGIFYSCFETRGKYTYVFIMVLLSSNEEKARQVHEQNSRSSEIYCAFRDTLIVIVPEF